MKHLRWHILNSDLAESEKRKAIRNITRSKPDEIDVVARLFEPPECWKLVGEILRGAYVRISDKGARYDDWKSLPTADTRRSSHRSVGDQFHIDGPLSHTILFGKFDIWTWVQLERHSMSDVVNIIGHGIDFFRYWRSGRTRNQGPYGTSLHSENRDPLIVLPSKAYTPIDRKGWVYHAERQPRIAGSSPFR